MVYSHEELLAKSLITEGFTEERDIYGNITSSYNYINYQFNLDEFNTQDFIVVVPNTFSGHVTPPDLANGSLIIPDGVTHVSSATYVNTIYYSGPNELEDAFVLNGSIYKSYEEGIVMLKSKMAQ